MNTRPADDETATIKRVSRPVVAVGALLLVAVLLVVAFVAGLKVRPPADLKAQSQAELVVNAQVEARIVQEGVQVLGKVSEPEILPLHLAVGTPLGAPADDDGGAQTDSEQGNRESSRFPPEPIVERNVVTGMKSPVGNELSVGSVLAEVSGRPVIAVPESTPLYRDLSVGITGEDVRAVQQLLADLGYWVDVDGVLDNDTMQAFRYWYAQLGYDLVSGAGTTLVLPWRELYTLPPGQLTVTNAAAVGAVVDEEHPLLKVRRGKPVIEVLLDEAQAGAFRSDSSVFLLFGGKSFPSEVLTIGDLETDADTGRASRAMGVSCPPEVSGEAAAGGVVTVSSATPNDPGPAVPITAINEDAKGTFVRVIAESNETETPGETTATGRAAVESLIRVDVEVAAVSGGWAAIVEHAELPEGTKVRVS